VGYGSITSARGLHPRGLVEHLVWRESELEKLDAKIHIIRIAARVGERKRIGIIAKAKEQNFHIANPGKGESRPVAETVEEREPSLLKLQLRSQLNKSRMPRMAKRSL